MTITRDPDFPAEIANLLQSFNMRSDGHSTHAVLEASANFLIAAIGSHARTIGGDLDFALALASQLGDDLPGHVAGQWNRQPLPTDVEVRHG